MDEIDWASLRRLMGTCEHVPAALEGPRSSDPAERRAAYWQLDNHVVVQGSLYEGAPYVAQALIELLQREDVTTGRAEMYELLDELSLGAEVDLAPITFNGRERTYSEAVWSCLRPAIPTFLADLGSPETLVRDRLSSLLLQIAEDIAERGDAPRAALCRAALSNALASEPEGEIRSTLKEAIEFLPTLQAAR